MQQPMNARHFRDCFTMHAAKANYLTMSCQYEREPPSPRSTPWGAYRSASHFVQYTQLQSSSVLPHKHTLHTNTMVIIHTVVPVTSDHPMILEILVVNGKWSLNPGSFQYKWLQMVSYSFVVLGTTFSVSIKHNTQSFKTVPTFSY